VTADRQAGVAVTASFLYNPLELGEYSPEEVERLFRHGQQALMVYQNDRVGLLLPFVAVMHNLDRSEFVEEVIDKAGITRPPYDWCRFDCATWLADLEGARYVEGGFAVSEESLPFGELLSRLAKLHAEYLVRQQAEDGSLYLSYDPFQDKLYRATSAPRLAHAAWILARARKIFDWPFLDEAADKLIDYHLKFLSEGDQGAWIEEGEEGEEAPSVSEASFIMLALCQLSAGDQRQAVAANLAQTLWSSIDGHGRITTHRPPADSPEEYQDYFPGQLLLALAVACEVGLTQLQEDRLDRAFKFYRHRFRYKRDYGQVSWLMQAFSAWRRVTGDSRFDDFVFEVGDWTLGFQQEKTGAFINDHQSDSPGYTTALYLEGIGTAARVARAINDQERHRRYTQSFERGLRFLDRLVIQQRDGSLLPNAEFAQGALRQSIYASHVRVDFVQHSLSAILEAWPGFEPAL
jgi:hypothetical protein